MPEPIASFAEFEERYLPETFEAKLTDEERGRRAVERALASAQSPSAEQPVRRTPPAVRLCGPGGSRTMTTTLGGPCDG